MRSLLNFIMKGAWFLYMHFCRSFRMLRRDSCRRRGLLLPLGMFLTLLLLSGVLGLLCR